MNAIARVKNHQEMAKLNETIRNVLFNGGDARTLFNSLSARTLEKLATFHTTFRAATKAQNVEAMMGIYRKS